MARPRSNRTPGLARRAAVLVLAAALTMSGITQTASASAPFRPSVTGSPSQLASAPATGLLITSSTAVYGHSTTLVVKIIGGAPNPGGGVMVSYAGMFEGYGDVSGGHVVFQLRKGMEAGTRRLRVSYSGDLLHARTAAVHYITRLKAHGHIAATGRRVEVGNPVPLSVRLFAAPYGRYPTGVITAFEGTKRLGSTRSYSSDFNHVFANILASGAAGTHLLTIKYSGDGNYSATSVKMRAVIDKARSKVWISSLVVVGADHRVRIPVSVTGGIRTATGTVTASGVGISGKGTLIHGNLTMLVNAPRPGLQRITLTYAGDRNYSSGVLVESVNTH